MAHGEARIAQVEQIKTENMTRIFRVVFTLENVFKIGSSLYVMLTSVYDIAEDVTVIRKEHGLLLIGLIALVKTGFEIKEKMEQLREEMQEVKAER